VARTYWLDMFTGTTWEEFLAAGGEVSGFRERRWKTVQRMKPGDYLLCYLTGISRWIAVLEVTSQPFTDAAPIWKDEDFPSRVHVRSVVTLTPETAVPILELRDQLSIFRELKNPNAWTGYFRGSPTRWKAADGDAVLMWSGLSRRLFSLVGGRILAQVKTALVARGPGRKGSSARWRSPSRLGVGGLGDRHAAPGHGGSANRHTDVRGSKPQVGYSQEGAPD
jgi:hypothetical protein